MIPLRCFAAALVSLGVGALFFLWASLQPSFGGGWVTVYLNAGFSDRRIIESLEKQGITAVGESSVWALLDDFSSIKKVPLDQWKDLVEPYDPRNDGYAEQLRSYFVGKGERRFFVQRSIPAEKLKALLRAELGSGEGVLWRVQFHSSPQPLTLLLFAAASAVSVLLGGLSSLFALACMLPVLAFLCLAGPAGLAPAGILTAVFFLLREPLAERFRSAQGASRIIHRSLWGELLGWLQTFPRELLGSLAGLALYILSCLWGNIAVHLWLPVLCFLIPVLLLPPWAEARTPREVFFPLPIRKGHVLLLFPPALPVFTLAFIAALAFSSAAREEPPNTANEGWPSLPGRAAYERHGAFQQSFSRRSLHDRSKLSGETDPSFLNRTVPPYPETLYRAGEERPAPALPPERYTALLGLMIALSVPALWRIVRRKPYPKK